MGNNVKLIWRTNYVQDGCIQPDRYGRWSLDGYIKIKPKGLIDIPVELLKITGKKYWEIKVLSIFQKENGDRYYFSFPSFEQSQNWGMSKERHYYSNDLDKLKEIAEKEFNNFRFTIINSF